MFLVISYGLLENVLETALLIGWVIQLLVMFISLISGICLQHILDKIYYTNVKCGYLHDVGEISRALMRNQTFGWSINTKQR